MHNNAHPEPKNVLTSVEVGINYKRSFWLRAGNIFYKGEAACLPFPFEATMNFKVACIFIDGENFRRSIGDLFTPQEFSATEYLPKQADWQGFFDYLVKDANAELRLRTYWYTAEEIDFSPYDLQRLVNQDHATLEKIIRRNKQSNVDLDAITDGFQRQTRMLQIAKDLITQQRQMRSRFDGWLTVQNGIASKVESVEFRRAGAIRYDLFSRELGSDKGIEVKLATDLLRLKDIYDVAIILSGDGDYAPAVQAVKDCGKHVINVSFLKKSGGVLPSGAQRLKRSTDRTLELHHGISAKYLLSAPAGEMPSRSTQSA